MNKHLLKRLFVCGAIIMCVALVVSYAVGKSVSQKVYANQANILLYGANYELNVLEYSYESLSNDPFIFEEISSSLVSTLFAMAAEQPNVAELQGTPLETLCRMMQYADDIEKRYKDNPTSSALNYLRSIQPIVMERIRVSQRLQGGTGCYMGKRDKSSKHNENLK